jgi:chorismate mutase/prephenate dehydrogenase
MPQKPPNQSDLAELRQRLDAIDDGIIDLAAERQAIVKAISEHKLRTSAPLRHYEREAEIISRGTARAESLGLSKRLAREMLETLIHHSLENQEEHKLVSSDHGLGQRALVIGGMGRMGGWMARFLDVMGFDVEVADLSKEPGEFRRVDDWERHVASCDLIVVAVTLRPSNEILLRLAEIKPPGLIFDIGSLKSPMRGGLAALAAAGCKVCSVHPMFGPRDVGLSGRHILFVDVGNASALAEARALFAHTAAECVDLSLDEHDEVMAWVLGLSHMVNVAFAGALAKSGEAVPLLRQISSSTFDGQLKVAAQVVSENPHLYFEIQQGNERTGKVLSHFRSVLDELHRSVEENDETAWTETMESAHREIGGPRNR